MDNYIKHFIAYIKTYINVNDINVNDVGNEWIKFLQQRVLKICTNYNLYFKAQ